MPEPDLDPTAFDRRACVATGLANARKFCAEQGLRLTPARELALKALLESHGALGAYEVLDRLRAEGLGKQPPVAYRALDFLVRNGLAHRIEKLNAFVACSHPGATHKPAFMICRSCRKVAEANADAAAGALDDAAERMGFEIERAVVEAEGVCPACRTDADAGRAR